MELTGASNPSTFKQSIDIVQYLMENIILSAAWIGILVLAAFGSAFIPRREDRSRRMPQRSQPSRRRK
jgi:hypothetical protein